MFVSTVVPAGMFPLFPIYMGQKERPKRCRGWLFPAAQSTVCNTPALHGGQHRVTPGTTWRQSKRCQEESRRVRAGSGPAHRSKED